MKPKSESPVRTQRTRLEMTQAQLAEVAGVGASTVSLVERAPALLTPRLAAQLAAALGVEAGALLTPAAQLRLRRHLAVF